VSAPAAESAIRTCGRAPASWLHPYVSAYTGYRQEATPPSVHQGVGSAHLAFLFCVEGRVEVLGNADPARPPGTFTAAVGGLHDAPARIAQGDPQTGLQLRLTWRGARALLGVPAGALAGDTVDLADLLPGRVAPLLDRLASASGWAERFAVLDAELTALLRRGRGERGVLPEVGYTWDRLVEAGGNVRIEELAREVGWSRRYLAEKFRHETGLGPKAAARVIRFEGACDRLLASDRPALAQVAAEAGYVDQSHLSRDFRDLAGIPATAWLAERNPKVDAGPGLARP
jgi:AraC-like DNA-binding protein